MWCGWLAGSLISALALASCGAETDDLFPLPPAPVGDPVDVVDRPEVEIVIQGPEREPQVLLQPSQLMFYGGVDSPAVVEPRTVTLTNQTSSTILVTAVYVVDAESFAVGGADAQYFRVETPSLDAPLGTDDTLAMQVSFTRSTEQRGAYLVVETTHPGFKSVVVTLAGKIFLGW